MPTTASLLLLATSVASVASLLKKRLDYIEPFAVILETFQPGAATADNYLHQRSGAPAAAEVSTAYEPSWEELTQVPVTLNANDWTALGKAKRLAVLCRLSVVHLTVISCVSGGLLAAAAGKGNALRIYALDRDALSLAPLAQRH